MNANLVSKENNTVHFTFQADAGKLEEGMQYAYKKNKSKITVPGFRPGKAPRKLIEAQYGESVFYDDAINYILGSEYEAAVKELGLEVVSKPELDVSSISKTEGVAFTASVTVKPDVTLGQYKGLSYEKINVEVTDDEVEAELKAVQEKNARTISVSDRPAQDGDIVNIGYKGTVDGEAFEGGSAESYDLTLGSHSFISGFEEQIVGHNIGDAFDVNVTFPEEYHEKSLAGKAAVFAVELKDISVKELAEINDEFAQDVSEFDTLDEYKASILDKIKEEKELRAKREKSDKLLDMAAANATMDVPQVMIEDKVNQMLDDFKNSLARQGLSIEMYYQYLGGSMDEMKNYYREQAEKTVRARLMLEKVAKEENFEVTEDEVKDAIGKIGESYGIDAEQMLSMINDEERENMKEDLRVQKAIDMIMDTAVEVEPKAEEEKAEE